jgi:hypothetical protein
LSKQNLGWPQEPAFYVPAEALEHMRQAVDCGKTAETEWDAHFAAYAKAYPELAREFRQLMRGELPTGWDAARARLQGLPGGGLNIAHEAVDRHVAAGHGAQAALIWLPMPPALRRCCAPTASGRGNGCSCFQVGCQSFTPPPWAP